MINAVADFSHWQATPNFVAMKEAGLVAVLLKATQGASWVDSTFVTKALAAQRAEVLVGAYHFADATSPMAQAAHFLSVASMATVLAIDVEPNGMGDTVTVPQAAEIVARVHCATDRLPLVYIGRYGPDGRGTGLPNSVLARCPLWIPAYTSAATPNLPAGWTSWTLWQWTDTPYDQDRFNGTLVELEAFWQ